MRWEALLTIVLAVLASTGCSVKKYPFLKDNPTSHLVGIMNFKEVGWKLENIELKDLIKKDVEGITTKHFTLNAGDAGSTDGYLFLPTGKGPFPGIFYMHWLGGTYPVNSGMYYFLGEAAEMAAKGYICIVPQGYFPWSNAPSGDADDIVKLQKQLKQMIGVMTIMLNQENLDAKNIQFVGHDYGAMHGFVFVSCLDVFSSAVFMTPNDNYADWNRIVKNIPGAKFEAYKEMLAPWDPVKTVRYLPEIPILFQFSNTDQYVSAESAQAIIDGASKNASVMHYGQGHALGPQAKADRIAFLEKKK